MANLSAVSVAVVSTSLDPDSRSRVLARRAVALLDARGIAVRYVDLRDTGDLPLAGAPGSWDPHPGIEALQAHLSAASHVLLAVPIYNYDASAAAKNLIELAGSALTGKTIGFLCAAGGARSYMAVLGLANSLMLDFRCWIVPRFVYATGTEVEGETIAPAIEERIAQLLTEMFERGGIG